MDNLINILQAVTPFLVIVFGITVFRYTLDRDMYGILALLSYVVMAASIGGAYYLTLAGYPVWQRWGLLVIAVVMLGFFINSFAALANSTENYINKES